MPPAESAVARSSSVPPGVTQDAKHSATHSTLGVMLVVSLSLNLRPMLTSVAPLLHDIQAGLGLSNVWISVLMTVPVVCLGLFGPLAAPMSRRFGLEKVLLAAIAVALAGGVLRSFGFVPLYAGTILIGAGISLLGILTPVLIKQEFPDKVGLMMGLFAMALGLGAAVSTASVVPITDALGGRWQTGLAVWMLPLIPAALLAVARLMIGNDPGPPTVRVQLGIMHDPVSWQLMGFFSLFASLAYALISWGPSMLLARGLDPKTSGFVMSIYFLAQMPSGLVVPIIAGRMRDQRLITTAMVILGTLGAIGLLLAPAWSLTGVALAVGIGQGGGFAIALTLLVLRAGTPQVAAKLSSMVQSVGYVIGGLVGPFAVGLLHDIAGSWSIVALFFAVVGAVSLVLGYGASRNRTVMAS
ncbi:MFS transporter [Sphingomonas sanguinis]|uniref:MFS transporter n=1 Tax=Sphingomonas sanguinis TaxID=33051 RepID=UPI001C55B975|nr:MFS transporter [Sphingomonas sanguinis]QXT34904.1 MFS transporter [Sphingomonas sanguinis]